MSRLTKGLRRRDFLAAIGRAAGGSALLRVMSAMGLASTAGCGSSAASGAAPGLPPPPPAQATPSPRPGDWPASTGAGKSVTVIGAGIAGMTAALELTRLGYTCTILEASGRAGGRNRTLRSGDLHTEIDSSQLCQFDFDDTLYFNAGPARIAHHHEFLLGYCHEFGVALEPFINSNRAALLQSPSTFGGEPQIMRRLRADTRGNIAQLLASAINQNALDQQLSAADRANVLVLLRQYGDLDGNYAYTGSARAGFPGQQQLGSRQRGSVLPAGDLTDLARDIFWQQRLDFSEELDQQSTMLQPVGGMDRIAQAFAAEVQPMLVMNAEVTEIRKRAGGSRVIYRDTGGNSQALDADYCLCTLPATVLRTISHDYSAAHASAIASFAYAPAGKLAFQSRRFREREHNIYGSISCNRRHRYNRRRLMAGAGHGNDAQASHSAR